MILPALVLVLAAAAAPQKDKVVSVDSSPLAADEPHLRDEPSSFLERSELYSGVEAACTLHPRFRSVELVAAVEEDLCASITKRPECMAIVSCAWLPVRKRSLLEREPPSVFNGLVKMKPRCQARNPLTIDQLTAGGVADGTEAETQCAALGDEGTPPGDKCRRNTLCRYGCFPPECGCYVNDKGYNLNTPQEVCTANMNNEDMCNANQNCVYRHSGLILGGFPVMWVVVGGGIIVLCCGGWCFMCIAVWNCCTPKKKHHHHHHDHHAHEEHAEHEEEWEGEH